MTNVMLQNDVLIAMINTFILKWLNLINNLQTFHATDCKILYFLNHQFKKP